MYICIHVERLLSLPAAREGNTVRSRPSCPSAHQHACLAARAARLRPGGTNLYREESLEHY
jgi:hypothetical protein